MSNALLRLRFIILFMILFAVLLSVLIGTGRCLCPSSSKVVMCGIAFYALIYRLPHSASAADDITAFMIFASM